MPIRINLLAEAQAAEEQRRKDPVKRAAYAAGVLVVLVIVWAMGLQVKILAAKSRFSHTEAKWKSIEKSYQVAADAQKRSMEAEQKLAALHAMTTNRFLLGNALNAFQQTLNGVDMVQVVRLKFDQNYIVTEGTPPRTNGTAISPAKPPVATEKVVVTVEGRDTSPQAARVSQYRDAIAAIPYFKDNLEKTNGVRLISRSAPQTDAVGRTFVSFSLQCAFPEKTR